MKGVALDWAVAQAVGVEVASVPPAYGLGWRLMTPSGLAWSPTRWWSQGGPLIEEFEIEVSKDGTVWKSVITDKGVECTYWKEYEGDTPLEAACRAVVALKLGSDVEVPKELHE